MEHWILNLVDGDRAQALSLLRAGRWPLRRDERQVPALAGGDVALIHVARPGCSFIGQAVLACAFVDEGDGGFTGVVLARVDEWPAAVPLQAAIGRIDPASTNPCVQANAAGFRSGLVQITAFELDAVRQLEREARLA